MKGEKNLLLHDILIIILSLAAAAFLAKTQVLIKILSATQALEFLGSFIAGIFFTSVFTTAPAIIALGELARVNTLIGTAAVGALGAIAGDILIFRFFKDRFSKHLLEVLSHRTTGNKFKALMEMRAFRWITFFVGGLIIASPLPDELGISLLGFSKMRMQWFIPISFIFNFAGILLIGIVARTL